MANKTSPTDINDKKEVVGWSTTKETTINPHYIERRICIAHAFIWKNGKMHDLNDLIGNVDGRDIESSFQQKSITMDKSSVLVTLMEN